MPRYSFASGALRGASGGLGNLAAAIAGANRTGQDAYEKELTAQSRIGQAIASAQANQARAAQDDAETAILARRPDVFEESVAGRTGSTIPTVRATREYMRTGVMPERELAGPADEEGNGPGSAPLVSPEQLSAITREISRLAPAFLGNVNDNKADDLAQADKIRREMDLSDAVIAGTANRNAVGGAQAAVAGKDLFSRDITGSVLDQFTGALDTSNPLAGATIGLRKDQAAQARAAAAENYAQAGSSRATADLRRQQASAVGQGGGKAPAGYRWSIDQVTGDPRLEFIPGGPADPAVKASGPLNEGQAKALLFGSRMAVADEILNELASKGKLYPNILKQGAEGVPLVGGGLGMAANATLVSESQQQVEQAQRDFINAVLRRESGASIAPAEFSNARIQYFPQPGDSPEVIKQKAANRRTAIEGMKADFGDAGMPRFLETVRGARAVRTAPKAQTKPAQGGDIPTVSTDADYARLPSGAQFRDPQGNLRRKQ